MKYTKNEHETVINKGINLISKHGKPIKRGILALGLAASLGYGGIETKDHFEQKNIEIQQEQIMQNDLNAKKMLIENEELLKADAEKYLNDGDLAIAADTISEAEAVRSGKQCGSLERKLNSKLEANEVNAEKESFNSQFGNANLADDTIGYTAKFGDDVWDVASKVFEYRHGRTPSHDATTKDGQEMVVLWRGIAAELRDEGKSIKNLEIGQFVKIPANDKEISKVQTIVDGYTSEIDGLVSQKNYPGAFKKLNEFDNDFGNTIPDQINEAKIGIFTSDIQNLMEDSKYESVLEKLIDENKENFNANQFELFKTEALDSLDVIYRNEVDYSIETKSFENAEEVVRSAQEITGRDYQDLADKVSGAILTNYTEDVSLFIEEKDFDEALKTIESAEEKFGTTYQNFRNDLNFAIVKDYETKLESLIENENLNEALSLIGEANSKTGLDYSDAMGAIDAKYEEIGDRHFNEANAFYSMGEFAAAEEELAAARDFASNVRYDNLSNLVDESLAIESRFEDNGESFRVSTNVGESVFGLAATYVALREVRELNLEEPKYEKAESAKIILRSGEVKYIPSMIPNFEGQDYGLEYLRPEDLKTVESYTAKILDLNGIDNPYQTLEEGTILEMPRDYIMKPVTGLPKRY